VTAATFDAIGFAISIADVFPSGANADHAIVVENSNSDMSKDQDLGLQCCPRPDESDHRHQINRQRSLIGAIIS
jgi:hypothetical protein